jgi:hypothetical protein
MATHRFCSSLSKIPEIIDFQACSHRKWEADFTVESRQLALKRLSIFWEVPAKFKTSTLIEFRAIHAAELEPLLAQQIAENHWKSDRPSL